MLSSPPNLLSITRLSAAPLLVAVFWLPQWTPAAANIAATIVFGLAAATDFMDGYLARKNQQQSRLGGFLDPVADKILVVTALLLLLDAGRAAAAACLIIIGREVFVSALREWAALAGYSVAAQVSALGKTKTAAQMIAVPCLFAADSLGGVNVLPLGGVLLWVAALLAAWSMATYCRAVWRAHSAANTEHVEND